MISRQSDGKDWWAMSGPAKTNVLAIVSFSSGLIALLSTALVIWLFRLQPVPGDMTVVITDRLLIPLRNLGMIAAVAAGIVALSQIKRGRQREGEHTGVDGHRDRYRLAAVHRAGRSGVSPGSHPALRFDDDRQRHCKNSTS